MIAKAYHILGMRVYLYRRVLDEIGFPKDEQKRYNFTTELGKWTQDKIVIHDEYQLKEILGDDYRARPNGYMFVTDSMKERIIEKFREK